MLAAVVMVAANGPLPLLLEELAMGAADAAGGCSVPRRSREGCWFVVASTADFECTGGVLVVGLLEIAGYCWRY